MTRTELYSVSLQGDTPTPLLADLLNQGFWLWASPHPDGRISLLGETSSLGIGFFTVTRDGKHITKSKGLAALGLQLDPQGLSSERFQWNNAGTALYLEATVRGVQNLWKVEVDPQTLEWRSAQRLTTGPGRDGRVALSRDGRQFAYTTWTESSRLWSFPLDAAAGRMEGAGTPVTEDQSEVMGSDLAPNGRSLAYVLQRPGGAQPELHIANLETGASALVAAGPDFMPNVVWSRDSKRITFATSRFDTEGWPLDARLVVRVVESAAQDVRPVGRNDFFQAYDWTPDGSALLGFYYGRFLPRDKTGLALWRVGTPTPQEVPDRPILRAQDIDLVGCRISPNGRWIAYSARRPGHLDEYRLAIAPLSGAAATSSTDVARGHEHPHKPRWAADGRVLYFLSRQSSSLYNLWATRFDPERGVPIGDPFPVTHFDSPSQAISPWFLKTEMSISARRAVLTMRTLSGSIWMLDNADK